MESHPGDLVLAGDPWLTDLQRSGLITHGAGLLRVLGSHKESVEVSCLAGITCCHFVVVQGNLGTIPAFAVFVEV